LVDRQPARLTRRAERFPSPLRFTGEGEPVTAGPSSVVGKVTAGEQRKRIANASDAGYSVSSAQVFLPSLALSNGLFEITGPPHEHCGPAMNGSRGPFAGNEALHLRPERKAIGVVNLIPSAAAAEDPRISPDAERPANGIAFECTHAPAAIGTQA
jgi:hypothetical protein